MIKIDLYEVKKSCVNSATNREPSTGGLLVSFPLQSLKTISAFAESPALTSLTVVVLQLKWYFLVLIGMETTVV
jgi:hypothetical protein